MMSWTCKISVDKHFHWLLLFFPLPTHPPLSQAASTLSAMFTELLLALVIGGLLFFLVQRSRSQVLKTEDGWWGVGAPPEGGEDVTIRPFEVTTSDEELEVHHQPMFIWGKSNEH